MSTRHLVLFLAVTAAACGTPDKSDDTDTIADTDVAQDTDVVVADTDPADTDTTDTDVVDSGDTDVAPPATLVSDASGALWSDGTYATSCRTYRNPPPGYSYAGTTGDGVYQIDPDGTGSDSAFAVLCDMTTDGGGWTQIAQATPINDTSYSLCSSAAVGVLNLSAYEVSAPAKLSDVTIQQIWAGGSNELMVQGDLDSTSTSISGWDTSCIANFAAGQSFDATTNGGWTLDGNTVECSDGTRTVYTSYAETDTCGFGFQFAGGSYLIWSYDPDYTIGCAGTTAGRTWPGSSGNNGCNTSKTWAR